QGGVITSSGDASQWKLIPSSGYNLQGIAGDGKSIYVSQQFSPGKYFMASESNPMSWKEIPNTGGSWGAYYMAADRDNHIIFGSETGDGLWRMVTYCPRFSTLRASRGTNGETRAALIRRGAERRGRSTVPS